MAAISASSSAMRACFCSSVIRLHPDQEKAPQRCYPHGAGCDRFDLDRASTGDLPGLRRSIFRSGPIAGLSKLVIVEGDHLVPRPAQVSWEQAGALFVAGTTAYAAAQALSLKAGDTVVVSGAAGGVGSIAVQLARNVGAKVIGLASAANHAWLADHGVIPIAYGEGLADRIRAASGDKIDAFIDTFGGGYVDLALELGVAPDRFDTIIDFAAAAKHVSRRRGMPRRRMPRCLPNLLS